MDLDRFGDEEANHLGREFCDPGRTEQESVRQSQISAHDRLDDRGGAAMSIGSLSPQQLRTIVEDKWQRDQDAIAVGLHITTSWIGPGEVEFDFGKAQVVRADTVFRVR